MKLLDEWSLCGCAFVSVHALISVYSQAAHSPILQDLKE
jgi:hypothetical protein